MAAKWFWGLATPATGTAHSPQVQGGVFMELARARARTLTVRCDPATSDEAAFTVSGSDPGAAFIDDLATDLVCQRESDVLFRGRIAPAQDTLDAGRADAQFTAWSYRELLRRRSLASLSTLSYTSVDQSAIVWALMDYTQGLPGGYLGVGRGVGAVGTGWFRTVTYTKDGFIFDAIAGLAQMDNGFDWNVTPHGNATDLRLDLWQGGLRVDKGVTLEWGGAEVKTATRTLDPGTFANSAYLTGDDSVSLTPVLSSSAGMGTDPAGRWESVIPTAEVIQASLAARGAYTIRDMSQMLPTWDITLHPGAWEGRGHIWPGDLVRWRVNRGRLKEDRQYLVAQLAITPGDSGDDQVTVSLGRVPVTLPRVILRIKAPPPHRFVS